MSKRRILIADASDSYAIILSEEIKQNTDYEVIGIVSTGEECLSTIKALHPDILILDLLLPLKDGLQVLKELCSQLDPPAVIANSMLITEYAENLANKYGASFLLPKTRNPAELIPYLQREDLINRLTDPYLNELTLKRDIHHTLDELHIPKARKGYRYLTDAVTICMLDPNAIFDCNKLVITPISNQYHYTCETVIAEMCETLNQAYRDYGIASFCNYLCLKFDLKRETPTLTQVIATIAEKVRLKY